MKVDVTNERIGVHYARNHIEMAEMLHAYMCAMKLSDGMDILARSWKALPTNERLDRKMATRLRAMADAIDTPTE